MSFHHHHHQNHHHATTESCCCHPPTYHSHHQPPPPPPSPPPTSADPYLMATIVSQLLHSQTNKPHSFNPSPHFLSSLLHRIHSLETSLNHLSSSSSSSSPSPSNYPRFYLKDAAARVIQTHFRAFLVRRSRILRMLKLLAHVKSTFTRLQSSSSLHGFLDFDSISRDALDLLLLLDSIQGEDQMIRDSKKSISREISQFLEMIDEVCVKRHQVMTRKIKSMRVMRSGTARSGHVSKGYSERAEGSKGRNVDDDEEKKVIENLRERVERIGKMSRAIEKLEVADDGSEGFEHLGEKDGAVFNRIRSKYGFNDGGTIGKSVPFSDGKKRVCFVEDGNTVRVYNVDGDKMVVGRDVDEIEETTKGRQDEEEAHSDGEQSSQCSEDVRSNRSYEADGNHTHDKEFTFPASQPLQMKPKADFSTRKGGVKIAE
ncbi:hypothetical protein vseg_014246 [Gypsophila vaccaria]